MNIKVGEGLGWEVVVGVKKKFSNRIDSFQKIWAPLGLIEIF